MPGFNRVTLLGNLTRDPQIKQLPSSTTVADFGMAMNRHYKAANGEDREEVCFIDCAAFGRQAELIGQYCKKGKQLLVEGRLKYDMWDDKNGGGKRSKVTVVVENFQFLGSRDETNGPRPGEQQQMFDVSQGQPQAQRPPQPDQRQEKQPAGRATQRKKGESYSDADIPF